jgi:hypothetical protein
MNKRFLVLFLGVIFAVTLLSAQTASELLQKGIYLQETVGDLDSAIKAYRQVVQMSKESRESAAQAQFRLGLCLLKKDQQAEAAKAFQQVIQMYPEQTDLVTKARAAMNTSSAPAPQKLLAAPWEDGEVLEYRMKMGQMKMPGADGMRTLYSVRRSTANPKHLIIESRLVSSAMLSNDRVEVDAETMRPLSGSSTNPMFRKASVVYTGAEAQFTFETKEPQTVPMSGDVFDLTELQALVRRLPLSPGYKGEFATLSPMSPQASPMPMKVTGEEDVTTPAGQFHCYVVENASNGMMKFWVSADASRVLVKYDMSFMVATLDSVHRPSASQAFHSDALGFSGTLPPGWIGVGSTSAIPLAKGGEQLQFVAPDSLLVATLTVEPAGFLKDPTPEDIRREAGHHDTYLPTGKVRASSWTPLHLSGHTAISWMVDAQDMMSQDPVVEYDVWIQSAVSRVKFYAKVGPSEFERLKPEIDAMLQTLVVR